MASIRLLSETLINQIAAGEMIERPASIIKELAENAMDAGATHISVHWEEGGIREIVINDNGSGIAAEDLPWALTRHATSKIQAFDDLQSVSTLGFRGEALASIASAAEVVINTATQESAGLGYASQIRSEGGKVSAVERSRRAQGTTITVRDLFFNIPARRQFLKSVTTESTHCLEICRRLALSHAAIGWKVSHQGKVLLDLPAVVADADGSWDEIPRWREVLGEAFFSHHREFAEQSGDFSLRGVLSLPTALTLPSAREMQFVFVNGRFVRDRTLLHAIREGYAEMKHDAKKLAFALWLNLPNALVDVNVSPMKTEVRFRSPAPLHQFVRQSVRKALSGVAGDFTAPNMLSATAGLSHRPTLAMPPRLSTPSPSPFQPASFYSASPSNSPTHIPRATVAQSLELFRVDPLAANASAQAPTHPAVVIPSSSPDEHSQPLGQALGLLHHLYIVAQNHLGMVLVEIHAAHERLLFERLKQQWARQDLHVESDSPGVPTPAAESLPAQRLLVPWRVRVSDEQAETFQKHRGHFLRLGMEGYLTDEEHDNRPNGQKMLVLDSVPSLLPTENYPALIHQLLEDLATFGESDALATRWEEVLATMACHGARRGKQTMSMAEMNQMLREMEAIERSGTCNHGRPSFTMIPLADIDRFFMRGE
jgi:DNA mismatch repair protein MutL